MSDVAVHSLRVEYALGHIKEGDVGVRRGLRAVGIRVCTQAAVGVAVADTVLRRADGVCGAGSPRTGRDRFEDAIVRVIRGSASGAVRDGESLCLVVLGSEEGVVLGFVDKLFPSIFFATPSSSSHSPVITISPRLVKTLS